MAMLELGQLRGERTVHITEDQIRQYEDDGVICLRGLFSAEWLERMRTATERVLTQTSQSFTAGDDKGRFAGDVNMWMRDEDFRAFVFEGPSWLIAKTLMRSSRVRLFSDQLFVKEPGTSTPTPWHHDQTYWPVLGDDVCSIWVTMDSVRKETSGLEYIRGSHKWGRRFDPEDFGALSMEIFRDAQNEKIPDIDAERDRYEFLSWDMEPGDCLVHHSLAVHGAGPNTSRTQRRRAISTRWFGDRAYFRPAKLFTSEIVGLEPGQPMNSAMFPRVPRVEDEVPIPLPRVAD